MSLTNMIDQILLAWNLMRDKDVPVYLKLVPVLVAAYILSPFDFLPEAFLGPVGLLDDPMAALIGIKLFVNLTPAHIVARYTGGADIVEGEVVPPSKGNRG